VDSKVWRHAVSWLILALVVALPAIVLGGCGGGDGEDDPPGVDLQLTLTLIADGFLRPNYVTHAGDGTRRLFVTEQRGTIRIIENGQVLPGPFLDLSGIVINQSEAGLLSVAFHPDYERNGRFFVNFVSERSGRLTSYVSEFRVSAGDPNVADPGSERVVLQYDQPALNHNGGLLLFGPDRLLYIGTGDGGGVVARQNAQDLTDLLGKVLRIDVDSGNPYSIPPGNPFVGNQAARGEIYAYGFRNPWRFSIDATTRRIYLGDVGENAVEEINLVEAGGNYGWPILEGDVCFGGGNCDPSGTVLPIYQYSHNGVCSVTGGYVYRGARYPSLRGDYLFSDFCAGTIWRLRQTAGAWEAEAALHTGHQVTSFGEDWEGELYLVAIAGGVYRIDAEPVAP
jgi:glucose/arabinose dehydrogenase